MDDRRRAKRADAAPIKIALGKHIRTLRTQRGWSQEELADRAGVHTTYLSAIERGERNPALENLYAIARALGISMAKLFGFREAQTKV